MEEEHVMEKSNTKVQEYELTKGAILDLAARNSLRESLASLASLLTTKFYSIGNLLNILDMSLEDLSSFFAEHGITTRANRVVQLTDDEVEIFASYFVKEVKRACRKGKYGNRFVTTRAPAGKDFSGFLESQGTIEDWQELFLDEEAIYAWFWSILDGDSPLESLRIEPSKVYGLLKKVSRRIKNKLRKRGRVIDARWEFFRATSSHQFYIFPEEDNSSNTTTCIAS